MCTILFSLKTRRHFMINFALTILVIFSFHHAHANFLVSSHTIQKKLFEKMRTEPIYLQRKFGRPKKIDLLDLGKKLTPFYYLSDDVFMVKFESLSLGCVKLTISEKLYAKKTSCDLPEFYLLEGYPHFYQVKDFNLFEFNHSWRMKRFSHKIKGFSFYYFLKDHYFSEEKIPPLDWYHFDLEEIVHVSNSSQNKFEVEFSIIFQRKKFHFYGEKEKVKKVSLKMNKGDLLFTDGRGKFIFYKKYQPQPFNFRILTLSHEYSRYLENIESYLFSHEGQKVCFMDYYPTRSTYDCEYLSLRNEDFYTFHEFDLLFFDIENNDYQIIK